MAVHYHRHPIPCCPPCQYTLHATWTTKGAPSKRHRLREAHVFYDPPEYYSGRFLSMDLDPVVVPAGMADWALNRTNDAVLVHAQNMRRQLLQVKAGMALALALNRTFVFPKASRRAWLLWGGVMVEDARAGR